MNMDEMQQLINELELEKSMLFSAAEELTQELDDDQGADIKVAKAEGIDFCIQKLKVLLQTFKKNN